ncbi:hypothetical protein F0562_012484 [Nyssa sinensis]|uniref:Uncharacterized protein n=1 Tax=Nyssa sinensis TaxID=561372 RepID=A0A5J4ZXG5_9ASTE|nr:hypothetical protein F0562_012484 [Nyssa sinensis]
MAALGRIKYESYNLEAQLQLQLLSAIEATNMIDELKKKLKDTEKKVDNLKKQVSELKSDLSIAETVTSKAEKKHGLEIEATKVTVVEKQKNQILKLGKRLIFDGYICLKTMAMAYHEVDTDMLELVEVSDIENEEYEKEKMEVYPTISPAL